MILRELLTKIGFDVDARSIDAFERSMQSAKSSILAVGATISAAAASIGLLIKNVANTGDEIKSSAEELGLSTDALQEWRFAADQANISNEELATGFKIFSRNVGQAIATGTGPFVDRMNQLGISIVDVNGKVKDNDTLLLEVADSMSKVKNASEVGAIGNELFGRSGLRLATNMTKGSAAINQLRQQAHDLNLILGEDAINSADAFNKKLRLTWGVVTSIKNEIGLALMPVIEDVLSTFLVWVQLNREFIKQNLTEFLKGVTKWLKRAWLVMETVIDAFESFVKICGGTENALIGLASAFLLIKLGPLLSGILSLTGFMWNLFAGIIAVDGGVLLIPIAIALLITAIIIAAQELAKFFGFMDEGFKGISAWEAFKIAILSVAGAIAVIRAINFAKWIYATVNALVVAAAASWGVIAPWLVFLALLGVVIYGLYKFNEVWNEILGPFTFIDKLKAAWMLFKAWIGSFFSDMTKWIGAKFDAFVDGIVEKVKWLVDKVKALNPFADDDSTKKDQSPGGVNLASNDPGRKPAMPPLVLDEAGNRNTRLGTIRNFFQGAANEAQVMAAAPTVAPTQIYNAGNNAASTVTNNRPVNVTSNVNVTVPPGTSTINQQDVTRAVETAWQDHLQTVLETGLYNNSELE